MSKFIIFLAAALALLGAPTVEAKEVCKTVQVEQKSCQRVGNKETCTYHMVDAQSCKEVADDPKKAAAGTQASEAAQADDGANVVKRKTKKKVKPGVAGTMDAGAKQNGATALTTSDCKLLLGGTVVDVSDGRCGASGKYCKSSAGSACISEQ